MKTSTLFVTALAGWAAIACGGSSSTGPAGQVTHLQKTPATDNQGWYVNNQLPLPDSLTALDGNDRPVKGVAINWTVIAGGGSVSTAVDTTDSLGHAFSTLTLGPTAHVQTVSAATTVAGVSGVTFTAFADTAPTSAAVHVEDDEFVGPTVAVRVNGAVTWTWTGTMHEHSVTFDDSSSATQQVGSYRRVFTHAGTYNYTCLVYGMGGSVVVLN